MHFVARFLLLLSLLSLGACSSSGDEDTCNSGSGGCPVDVNSGQAVPDQPVSLATDASVEIKPCLLATSDPDGDGYGFEQGASCTTIPDSGGFASITDVIFVTGQSNVEAADTTFDSLLDAPSERVYAFTDSGWQIADLHQVWDEQARPGNHSLTDPTRQPNNNFTFHFSKSLAEKSNWRVPAFIVDAEPGKGIANWDLDSPFYKKISEKITRALAQIPHKDSLDVVLWHQGESDWIYEGTSDPEATGFTSKDSEAYRNYYSIKLNALIQNFRQESWARPDTVFICGETRVAEGVNRHLRALNSDADPLTGCVPTSDLEQRADDPFGIHYSAAGLRALGARLADLYISMVGG